ncbi:MAG: hypothetical protein JKY50_09110 [Oleispira sp.]|nr:hypothetical protein [Oleispira sp.]MBL4880927.1 hypothetical protein [Oleispira sp.]
MFNRATILWLLYCSALLSGCASTPINFWQSSTEQLIENHHYQQALEQISADTPIDQALLLKVKKLAEVQRKKRIYEIGLLIKQQQWGRAREALKQLDSNQPNLISFTTLNLLIDKAQFEEERLVNTQLALLEAQLLVIQLAQQDLSDRIYYDKINWFFSGEDLKNQKQPLAEKLLRLSTQALLINDYKNAHLAYEKAIELDSQLDTGELTIAINTGLTNQYNKAISERRNSLIKQLSLAISIQDFDYIIKIQEILSHKSFYGPDVDWILSEAKKIRSEHSRRLDEIAKKEYRKGNISFAVTQWQQALQLTPSKIKIQEKLIRAQKVQRKLEKLTASEKSSFLNY